MGAIREVNGIRVSVKDGVVYWGASPAPEDGIRLKKGEKLWTAPLRYNLHAVAKVELEPEAQPQDGMRWIRFHSESMDTVFWWRPDTDTTMWASSLPHRPPGSRLAAPDGSAKGGLYDLLDDI